METLSLDDITGLLSNTRTKGEYATVIEEFANDPATPLYIDFRSLPQFATKDTTALVQSINGNLKKLTERYEKNGIPFPACRVAKTDTSVLLINTAVHAAMQAEAAAAAE